jgi:soluble lytic murein transglycosylase-like protein
MQMTIRGKDQVLAVILVVMLSFAAGSGLYVGGQYEAGKANAAAKVLDARHSRIMAIVEEHNPDASLRDFKNFPEILLRVSAEYKQDYRLILALIEKESDFNSKAIGKSGEICLMQIMPDTAKLVAQGLKLDYKPPTKKDGKYVNLGSLGDTEFCLTVGVAFLAERIQKFGDVPTGLQAYNRGDDKARERRPLDDYAKSIAFTYVALVPRMPER